MFKPEEELFDCAALVVDPNPTSRSIVTSHLREFGVGTVVQTTRTAEARIHLESRTFDFVLCELHFEDESESGQDLLDDLRRNQLLPYSTVFIMITGEATYARVAEAAESALDGYLLKPHRAVDLGERLRQARLRKVSLQEIFSAIESENFEHAAHLCLERFNAKGPYWLYAARIGAELLLRTEHPAQAQALYRAVVAAKTLPWARLGVARAQLDAGQITQATSTLENLISSEPSFADAYDVMGRAQFELGRFDKALETYKMAAMLTPASISRLQNLAMMTYYAGDPQEAERLLDRTVRRGMDSKMFDYQSLVLLAFTRLKTNDRKGLQRCQDDFTRLMEKSPDNARLKRLSDVVSALSLIQKSQFAESVEQIRTLSRTIDQPDFDFESACNMLALMAQLALKIIQLKELDAVVERLGLRFCSHRSLTELLASSANAYPPYAERIRTCQSTVLQFSEAAVTRSMAGEPGAAIQDLIFHAQATLSPRLIDNAYQLLQKYANQVVDITALTVAIDQLRLRYGTNTPRATLGEQKRQAGGLALRAPPIQAANP